MTALAVWELVCLGVMCRGAVGVDGRLETEEEAARAYDRRGARDSRKRRCLRGPRALDLS